MPLRPSGAMPISSCRYSWRISAMFTASCISSQPTRLKFPVESLDSTDRSMDRVAGSPPSASNRMQPLAPPLRYTPVGMRLKFTK